MGFEWEKCRVEWESCGNDMGFWQGWWPKSGNGLGKLQDLVGHVQGLVGIVQGVEKHHLR